MLNMGKTFILGNNQALKELEGVFIQIPLDLKTNEEDKIHNWLVPIFEKNKIEKVVIEIGEYPLLPLQIGYHIRLSIDNLKEQSLVPILFVSTLSLNSVMLQAEIYSQILATKGVFFSEFELSSIQQEIEHLTGLNDSEYLTKFLKTIHIQPDETVGRHSLANIWGAYALDKAANTNALPSDSKFKKALYFKYISAFNSLDKLKTSSLKVLRKINIGNVNKIEASDKRILLVDDEAEKGWETVLRKVFKTTNDEDIVVINEKVKDYDSLSEVSKRTIETKDFDLYLIDLRLNGLEEDENVKTEEFSGMKVLRKIKSLNEGRQVIIFTASNKVWNLKALLDAGADDYYMKESPEYNLSDKLSEQNYQDFKYNAERCFKRKYLKEVYVHLENAKSKNTNTNRDFVAESNTAMDIAWQQIKKGYLDFGFLTLYQCLESYANSTFNRDDCDDAYKINGTTVIESINDKEKEWLLTFNKNHLNGSYFSSGKITQGSNIEPTTLYKISCLLHLVYEKDDNFLQHFGKLNKLRNDIAHKGSKGLVFKENVIDILNIIEEFRGDN